MLDLAGCMMVRLSFKAQTGLGAAENGKIAFVAPAC